MPNSVAPDLAEKFHRLCNLLRGYGCVAVAFSGGVDSSFLLWATRQVLGDRLVALQAASLLHRKSETADAVAFAQRLGSRHEVVRIDPLAWPGFAENSNERCYLCKKKLYALFLERMPDYECSVLLDGTNLDDLSEDRPGLRAIAELSVRTPLAECGLAKKEIRHLSRAFGLPAWNRHAQSCLATRIAHNSTITHEKLTMINAFESFLQENGFLGCRVRLGEKGITIFVLEEDIRKIAEGSMRRKILAYTDKYGIDSVHLDMKGRAGIAT